MRAQGSGVAGFRRRLQVRVKSKPRSLALVQVHRRGGILVAITILESISRKGDAAARCRVPVAPCPKTHGNCPRVWNNGVEPVVAIALRLLGTGGCGSFSTMIPGTAPKHVIPHGGMLMREGGRTRNSASPIYQIHGISLPLGNRPYLCTHLHI